MNSSTGTLKDHN